MQIYRKRTRRGKKYRLYIQLRATDSERLTLIEAGLMNIKIHKNATSVGSKSLSAFAQMNTFRQQVNRIRTRWDAALLRTTGSVFLDLLILYVKLLGTILKLIFRLFFGTRPKVSTLLRGIKVSSSKVEHVKEAETFILVTIAALERALAYAKDQDREDVLEAHDLQKEVIGLSFIGGAFPATQSGRSSSFNSSEVSGSFASYAEEFDDDAEYDDIEGSEVEVDVDI